MIARLSGELDATGRERAARRLLATREGDGEDHREHDGDRPARYPGDPQPAGRRWGEHDSRRIDGDGEGGQRRACTRDEAVATVARFDVEHDAPLRVRRGEGAFEAERVR